jgi:hypothetical protein
MGQVIIVFKLSCAWPCRRRTEGCDKLQTDDGTQTPMFVESCRTTVAGKGLAFGFDNGMEGEGR